MLLDVGPALCGFPGVVHGGITATIIDEALGRLAAAALGDGRRPVTANLKILYKKPIKVERHYTPPGWDNVQSGNDNSNNNGDAKDGEFAARIVVRSWVVKKDTKRGKVWVKAEVHPAEGYVLPELRVREQQEESRKKCLATGEALFVVPRGFKPPPIVGEMGGLGSDDVEKS